MRGWERWLIAGNAAGVASSVANGNGLLAAIFATALTLSITHIIDENRGQK